MGDFGEVTRLEIIDKERTVIFHDPNKEIELSLQDDNRTLKIFIKERANHVSETGVNAESSAVNE